MLGTLIRLVLAFTTDGQPYDINVLDDLRRVLRDAPLEAYATPIGPGGIAWPYPPGFFPLAWLADRAGDLTGLAYTSLVRVPSIAADAAIALLVHEGLRHRGASELRGLAATALVAFGPSFAVVSGFHGQLDNLAILPAVAAIVLWDRLDGDRRPVVAGLLIGIGFAIKTTPVFVVLALLPAVRSWREAGTLLAATAAIPIATLAPYLVASPSELVEGLRYRGFPGTSGLSIALQPELAEQLTRAVKPSGLVQALYDHGQLLVPGAMVAVAAVTARRGRGWDPAERASLLWLTFYVTSSVFFFQYLVWGLPFLLLAGRLRLALAVQVVALPPTVLFYRAPWESDAVALPYGIAMVALWALFLAAFVAVLRAHRPGPPA